MDTATKLATAGLKEEDVLDVIEAAESLHLSPGAAAAQEALLQALETVYCVYTKEI